MKKIIFCFVFFSFLVGNSQNNVPEEIIIYSTSNKNVNLFFPSSIKSAIVGNSNFTFGYSKENNSNIGILKAKPGEESNLLVITDNGNIYSFIIRYSKEIKQLNYFIKNTMSIGNESAEDIEQIDNNEAINKREVKSIAKEPSNVVEAITVNNYEISNTSDSTSFYKAYCLKELGKASFYNRIYGTKDKIFVKLKNLTYINNELYFTISLQNVSTLDYDINYLNFYITSRNKKRNTTTQTIPYKYQYVHNLPSKIHASETIDVVFVYQKFSINENKILLIEMTEDNGEREVKLEIPNTFINNPNSNNKKQE